MAARQVVSIMGGSLSRSTAVAELQKFSRMETPYGTVRSSIRLERVDGQSLESQVNNPFALLWAASVVQPKFGSFLMRHTHGQATIVLYTDETTPGNNKRPDKGRSFEALLWTFKELPDWFRSRQHGWFKFGYMLSTSVESVRGGMAAINKSIILSFFQQGRGRVQLQEDRL